MNNMKRLIAVMLVLTMALCLVACGAQGNDPTTAKKPDPTTKPATQPTTTTPTAAPTDPAPSHTVKVVDQDGNPVAGIAVQLCDNGSCFDPQVTNEEGIASFFMPGIEGAKARIYALMSDPTHPYGRTDYTIDVMDGMDEEGYMKFNENTEITLTMTKVAE